MRDIFKPEFKLVGLATAFVLLFGLSYMAGTISTSRNSAFAQAATPQQTASPTQPATTDSQPATGISGETETAGGSAGSESTNITEAEDVDNQAALQGQARITSDQAKQAALAKVPGTVVTANLEDENGTAVYTVIVTPATGGANQDVKVGASDGNMLKVEAVGQEDGGSEN